MEFLAKAGLGGLLALALAGYIVAERRGSAPGMWATKPLASACFLLIALPPVDRWLIGALALSFVGDLLLIPRAPRVFRAGILVFLIAHLAFIAAFAARGFASWWTVLSLAILSLAAWAVARRLLPRVDRALKAAVLAYVVVITMMVAAAAGAVANGAPPLLLGAALAFYANDLLVARDRFLQKDWRNRLVGLPLYYGAMVLFAVVASGSIL